MNSPDFINYLKTKHCVFWDWNGTLIDDLDYSLGITNGLLESKKIATLSKQYYQNIFTIPVSEYYEKLGLKEIGVSLEETSAHYISQYEEKRHTLSLFDGAHSVLGELKKENVTQVLFSAAHTSELEFQVKHHKVSDFFKVLSGAGDFLGGSKLDRGRALKKDHSLSEGVVIGDTLHDVETGKEIGFETVWVSKGHQSLKRAKGHKAADYIFDREKNLFYKNS